MGARADAARAEVLAARQAAAGEAERLEAAVRSAVDIPTKVRRNPAKMAGLAASAGFIAVGGPKRLLRGIRNAVLGPPDPLPKSMLPKEIDDRLKKLGDDGERVRGIIEREFAEYLEEKAPQRRERDLGAVAALTVASVAKPVTQRLGRELVKQLFEPESSSMSEQLEKIRARRSSGSGAQSSKEPPASNR